MFSFHSKTGASDFLGLRRGRSGEAEIVYDDGRARRLVWRVTSQGCDESSLRDAMEQAVSRPRVVAALFAELSTRAVTLEVVSPG
jgi:hypothetical protein